jgi:hypothetical protein
VLTDFDGVKQVALEGSEHCQAVASGGIERHCCEVRCLPSTLAPELESTLRRRQEVVVSFPYLHIADVSQQSAVVAAEASQSVAEVQVVPLQ